MLILVQHGEAASKDVDPERPLTDGGRQEVDRVAAHLAAHDVRPAAIWHSGKLRAEQTAELMGAALAPGDVHQVADMAPLDDPASMADAIASEAGDLMLVGHLPHLSRLATLLLTGAPEPEIVRFRMGGAVALERDADAWRLIWFVTPEMI